MCNYRFEITQDVSLNECDSRDMVPTTQCFDCICDMGNVAGVLFRRVAMPLKYYTFLFGWWYLGGVS